MCSGSIHLTSLPLTSAAPLYMPRDVKARVPQGHALARRPTRAALLAESRALQDQRSPRCRPTARSAAPSRSPTSTTAPTRCAALVIKLFLNIHKPGAPRDGGAIADYLTSGVHIDAFAVNGAADAVARTTPALLHLAAGRGCRRRSLPHDSVRLAVRLALRDLAREPAARGCSTRPRSTSPTSIRASPCTTTTTAGTRWTSPTRRSSTATSTTTT